jgi:molybdopterin molybdotransferase
MSSYESALSSLLADLAPLGAERASLTLAHGRVLAEHACAPEALPVCDSSAMDGFAVHTADTANAHPDRPVALPVNEKVAAGSMPSAALPARATARIFTGAPLPSGADAVVMQEHTRVNPDGSVVFTQPAKPWQHVRRAGSDFTAGETVVAAGAVLRPGELAVLVAVGLCEVAVVRRPRVAILPTGNEVVELGQAKGPGQVRNANGVMLEALVKAAGGIPWRLPIVRDDSANVRAALVEAARGADLVLTTGGVSVGDYDLVKGTIETLGELKFWRVAIKPGKPVAFGWISGTPVLGLPGNPASTMVTFELFARPAMRRLQGFAALSRPRRRARLVGSLDAPSDRRSFYRGSIALDNAGRLTVAPARSQDSGHVSSLLATTALIDVAPNTRHGMGDDVEVIDLTAEPI